VIVINTTYQLALWADALYASDTIWWQWHKGAPDFPGLKFALQTAAKWPGVQFLENTGHNGLELSPSGVRHGHNSGHQAINLAVHLGVRRVVLLGYDMQPGPRGEQHWHADHPKRSQSVSNYAKFRENFRTLVEPLRELGVDAINCTRRTALDCFPCQPLETVL